MNVFIEFNPLKSESGEVRVCRGCLATDCSLYDLREKRLEQTFGELTGLTASDGLLCSVCLHLLRKFSAFRTRCRNTSYILKQIHSLTTADVLSTIDRTTKQHRTHLKKSKIFYVNGAYCPKNTLIVAKTLHINIPDETEIPTFEGISKIETEPIDDHDVSVKYENLLEVEDQIIEKTSENQSSNDVDMTSLIDSTNNTDDDNIKETQDSQENDETEISDDDSSDDDFTEIGTQKIETTKKNTEVLQKAKLLINEIAKLFINIWRTVSKGDGDYYQMFERMHKASLVFQSTSKVSKDGQNKRSITEKMKFMTFLKLYKDVAELYNVDLEFFSIEEQRCVMDEKRQSANEQGQCNLCCKKFTTFDKVERHMKRSHDENLPFKCEICFYTFKKQPTYLLHLLKTHSSKTNCRECGQIIASNSRQHWEEAKRHLKIHRGTVFSCKLCGKTFNASKNCSMHFRSVHRAQMDALQCLMCGDSYNGPVGLRRHIKWMHTEAVRCATCSTWFLNEKTFAAHVPGDSGCQKEHSCPLCGTTFASAQLMRKHYDERHARYKCTQCNLTFIELKSYKEHYNKLCPTGERPPIQRRTETAIKKRTPKINKAQKSKQKQRITHNKFICDICGKSDFTSHANLKYHQRIHTGEKPFKCDLCDKTFRLKLTLKTHMWTHTGEKHYMCSHCPRMFRQHSHLRAHMPSHTKEKAHECNICHKRFTQRSNMLEHVRTLHEGLPPKRRTRHRVKKKDSTLVRE